MKNMEIWGKVCTPPSMALKEIKAGDLKGYSDISPMWRIQVLTDVFGPCGLGWYYEITKKWTETGVQESLMCFVDVNLFVKYDGEWSKPIQGTGGSMLINKFKTAGLKNSDEGYKMALTDALSVAMKSLGVAAQVYSGFDQSKYHSYFGVKKELTFKDKQAVIAKTIGEDKTEWLSFLIEEGKLTDLKQLNTEVDIVNDIYDNLRNLKDRFLSAGN